MFAGAIAPLDETPLLAAGGNGQRSRLVASGRLARQGDHDVVTDDTLFKTPSAAARVLTGSPVNGRESWRDASGVTLKDHQISTAEGQISTAEGQISTAEGQISTAEGQISTA